MSVVLVWDPALAQYRFPAFHPMKPERFTLAVDLMRAWNLLDEGPGASRATSLGTDDETPRSETPRAAVVRPRPATTTDLRLFHTAAYIGAVQTASANPLIDAPSKGLGDGDTPTFAGMHEAAALAVGSTMLALDSVLGGRETRAFNPAGGLHHAHRDRASGFCVYNDCAIAMERATREHEGLRVAYVDIDAHHGDGVEEAFRDRRDVLTLSVHESGRYLFPGTGDIDDIGLGDGVGYALNVPLPPSADLACYDLVFEEVIQPALRGFQPDVIVSQIGADSNVADPLTHLKQTIAGQLDLIGKIVGCAEELCGGRIVLTGGGGYEPFTVVPRIWAGAMALLLGVDVPKSLPDAWVASAIEAAASYGLDLRAPAGTFDEAGTSEYADAWGVFGDSSSETALVVTRSTIDRVRRASPLLGGGR